jgi:hypothetical protein
MLRPEYLFIWILFHLAAVELPKAVSKRGQPDLRATELVSQMQYQRAVNSYTTLKNVKSDLELRSLAYSFKFLGKNDTAISLYRQLSRRFPNNYTPTDQLNLALLHRRRADYDRSDSLINQLKMQAFSGYPILKQAGTDFLQESELLSENIEGLQKKNFSQNSKIFLPVKNPNTGEWYFHERRFVKSGLMPSIDLSDGLPFAKIIKASNWYDTTVSGKIMEHQSLNRHMELTHIDLMGNMYLTTNHKLVNDSDRYLLDIFRYYFNPKTGAYTMEAMNENLWLHNMSGFVMSPSQGRGLFCSDMEGGFGKSDIYLCEVAWNEKNEPKLINYQNIGEEANTIISEMDPCFITEDIIAFSTEGHVGFGSNDIYFYDLVNQKLLNAGNKINTKDNEYGVRYIDGQLYWTSEDENGKTELRSVDLSVELIEWVFNQFNVSNEVPGNTYTDGSTEVAETAVVTFRKPSDDSKANMANLFNLDVEEGLRFLLYPDSIRLSMSSSLPDTAFYSNYRLQTLQYPSDGLICEGKFETELRIVINILKQRPDWVIDIRSYTDAKGTSELNLKLSQDRADFIKDYFIFYGVDRKQIEAVGYGEQFLLNHCSDGVPCTEEEHRRNRRTTMHFKKRKIKG